MLSVNYPSARCPLHHVMRHFVMSIMLPELWVETMAVSEVACRLLQGKVLERRRQHTSFNAAAHILHEPQHVVLDLGMPVARIEDCWCLGLHRISSAAAPV